MPPATRVTVQKLLAKIPWNSTVDFEVTPPRAGGRKTVPVVVSVIDPSCGLRVGDRIAAVHSGHIRYDAKFTPSDEIRSLLFQNGEPRTIEVVRLQYPEGQYRLGREEEREQALEAIMNMPEIPTDVVVPERFQGLVAHVQNWHDDAVSKAIEIPLPVGIISKKRNGTGHLEVGPYERMIEHMGQGGYSLPKQLVFMYCCSEKDPRDAAEVFGRNVLPELQRIYRFKAKITVNGGPKYLLLAPWESHKPKGTADEDANLAEEPDPDDAEDGGDANGGGGNNGGGNAPTIHTASDRLKLAVENARRAATGADIAGLNGHEYDNEVNNLTNKQFPVMPKGDNEVQDERWFALYDAASPKPLNSLIINRPKVLDDHLKDQENRGSGWIIFNQVIAMETSRKGHLTSAILYETATSALKMYPEENVKDGRGYRLPFGWLCSVTILNLAFSRLGFLPGNPIGGGQSQIGKLWAQGWYEDDAATGRREYHVVQVEGRPLMKRVLIATYGYNPSSIRRDGGGSNWDSTDAFLRACVVTLGQIENSCLSQFDQVQSFENKECGSEVTVVNKKLYRGVDSLLTVKHAAFASFHKSKHRYIDELTLRLCKQVAEADVENNAIVFAPCHVAITSRGRKARMQTGDCRGSTQELRNEYWSTLRPFKRRHGVSNDKIYRRVLYESLFNAVKDLGRPIYLCYYGCEASVLVDTEEKKYFLLHPVFSSYLIRSDLDITEE